MPQGIKVWSLWDLGVFVRTRVEAPWYLKSVSIQQLQEGEENALAEALAEAFRDNPLNRAVVARDVRTRVRVNRVGMWLTLESGKNIAEVWTATGDLHKVVGGLIAVPPGGWPLPGPAVGYQIWGLFRQGLRATHRWGHVYSELERVHPSEPHWYLSTLGIHPDYQRQGLASALMKRWLATVDESRFGSYLETDHPESLSFYLRYNFEIREELMLWGVPIWRLWRPGA